MIVELIRKANRQRLAARHRQRIQSDVKVEAKPLRADRRTMLVVSHEASRTGAPILAWNICRQLKAEFNVLSLLLRGGELHSFFDADSDAVIGPFPNAMLDPVLVADLISRICDRYEIHCAIVNSIESRSVLRPLASKGIPTVLLVHEFFAYSRPKNEFVDALAQAGEIVFSAKVVRDNALSERTRQAIEASHLVPQGKSLIPVRELGDLPTDSSFDAIRAVVTRATQEENSFVVLGAGTVQYRKGVDLFIATAAELKRVAPEKNITLIWIGHGFDPERDLSYGAYVQQQIESAKLDRFHLLKETTHFERVYELADVLFLSSRLDPLPNVAIDAMAQGLPVICFDSGTGIAELLAKTKITADCIVPFSHVGEAARKILQMHSDESYRQAVSATLRELASRELKMSFYIAKLLHIADQAIRRTAQEAMDAIELNGTTDFNEAYARPFGNTQSREELVKAFVRTWPSGIDLRRPMPGFDPHCYVATVGPMDANVNPLAHYIRAGRPDGPWNSRLIDVRHKPESLSGLRCALHIHAFYVEMLAEIVARVVRNNQACDLFVSVTSAKDAKTAQETLRSFSTSGEVRIVPNRGRDIGPLLSAFAAEWPNYDVVGHVHTKMSLHLPDRDSVRRWSDFLLGNLIGHAGGAIDPIVQAFAMDPQLGLVQADDPHIIGWSDNRTEAARLAVRMNLGELPLQPRSFPLGTMFWSRPAALAPLFSLGLRWEDYPAEPLPNDGSTLHAIERLLPLIVERAGYHHAVAYDPALTR